ncbi:MAG: hypothetical protein QNJ98_17330 [Planctomycetota bacterium]|nr:hypothetical protein [Planctomycetota bacterium]
MTERAWQPLPLLAALALACVLVVISWGDPADPEGPVPAPVPGRVEPAPEEVALAEPAPEETPRTERLARARMLLDPDPQRRIEALAELRADRHEIVERVIYAISAARSSSDQLEPLGAALKEDPALALPVALHRISFAAARTRLLVVEALTPTIGSSPEAAAIVFVRAVIDPARDVRRAAFVALQEVWAGHPALGADVPVGGVGQSPGREEEERLSRLLEHGVDWFGEDPLREAALSLVLDAEQTIAPGPSDEAIALLALELQLVHVRMFESSLQDKREAVRRLLRGPTAVWLAAHLESDRSLEPLRAAHGDRMLERAAGRLLGALALADVEPAMAALDDEQVARLALIALARAGPVARPALPALLARARTSAHAREMMAAFLAIDPASPQSLDGLRRLVQSGDLGQEMRIAAALVLVRAGALGEGWATVSEWSTSSDRAVALVALHLACLHQPAERARVAPWFPSSLDAFFASGRRLRRPQKMQRRRLRAAYAGEAGARGAVLSRMDDPHRIAVDARGVWRAALAWAAGD